MSRAVSGSSLYGRDNRIRNRVLRLGIMIGKQYKISGMTIEIISDDGERWKTHNVTTNEIIYFDKSTLEKAIKLGKAEELTEDTTH